MNHVAKEELYLIYDSFWHIEDETDGCITFQPQTYELDYIKITKPASGCSSYVGRIGGPQNVNLGSACFKSTESNPYGYGKSCHELIHALG